MKKIIYILLIMFFASNSSCFAEQSIQVNDGRFVLYQHPQFRGDKFILDTRTGKIWQVVENSAGDKSWQQMFFHCYKEDKTYSGSYTTPR